ncbi:MAG: MlaE family lipid ABC transporter permease subunit [Gammaproteobacteria bacterium]|nr:MlaE family lipid ABC transporter permease subunit [Gammaproteobacteria bacterium]
MPLPEHTAEIQAYQDTGYDIALKSKGCWTVNSIRNVVESLAGFCQKYKNSTILWDVSATEEIDSAGMMVFITYYDHLLTNKCSVTLKGVTEKHQRLDTLVRQHSVSALEKNTLPLKNYLLSPFHSLGQWVVGLLTEIILFMTFFGESSLIFFKSLMHPSRIRYAAIVKNIEQAGIQALPIVALTSFLIGIVITYQGAVQLEKFGANIFIVEMISISVTRELAPLITAIVVAGRTGSSYTAQLGVMKITEEIDAMKTMGFNPHHFLVIPRILALIITLPLLVFFADVIGIFAGMLISEIHLQLSFSEFLHRLQNVLDMKHVWIGIIKAPVFAVLIAMVSCFRGFQVEKNSDSIGRYTTISVVNAIFLVIACDAIFSVILTELGI